MFSSRLLYLYTYKKKKGKKKEMAARRLIFEF